MKLIWGLTVVSLLSKAAVSWADDHPEAASPDDDTARQHKITTDVLWPIGALAAGAGTFLILRWREKHEQRDGISFSPEWSTRYGGLCVQGRF